MIGDIDHASQTSELSGYESGCEDESRREEETRGSLLGQKRLSESDKDLSLAKQGKVVRFGDMCNQHGDYLQSPGIGGSSNLFVNGRPVHRQGDEWSQHASTDPYKLPHISQFLLKGSNSVFVNGKAIARTGDLISCGAIAEEGSDNVFAG